MSKRKKQRKHRRLGRRSTTRSWMAVLRLTTRPPGFAMDAVLGNAILYTVALHSRPHGASMHGLSVADDHVRLVFTAPVAARDAFLRAVARDAAGYIGARFEGSPCAIAIDEPVPLADARTHLRALAEVAIEGGVTPFDSAG